jgi:hypothetical protein
LDYATFAVRNVRWLAFNIWEFVALAVLLYRPVGIIFSSGTGFPVRPQRRWSALKAA